MVFEVRRLGAGDVDAFRAIRREGLMLEPANFEASPEEDAGISREEWIARLARGDSFGVFDTGALVGVASYRAEKGAKVAHRGHLSGFYLTPAARRTGAAQLLMRAVLDAARRDVAFLYLIVTHSNARAIRFYEKFGFTAFGHDPGGLLVDGHMHEDCLMVLRLKA